MVFARHRCDVPWKGGRRWGGMVCVGGSISKGLSPTLSAAFLASPRRFGGTTSRLSSRCATLLQPRLLIVVVPEDVNQKMTSGRKHQSASK